jgi:3'-5' exoribonuclease
MRRTAASADAPATDEQISQASDERSTWAPVSLTGQASVPPPALAELLTLATVLGAPTHQRLAGCALVLRCDVATDRAGHPYLALTMRGGDGERIEARWWRYPHPLEQRPAAGQIYWLRGDVDVYRGERQLRLQHIRPAPDVLVDRFVRTARRSADDLRAELSSTMERLAPDLAALVRAVLSGDVYDRFCTWPAAQQMHGAVRHGLLAHSLRVATLAQRIAAAYLPGGLPCEIDVVTAACLLHDVGKVYCLPAVAGAAVPDEALQCDHVTRGVLIVQAAAARLDPGIPPTRLDQVTHALLAHHGRREWGAPVEPQTAEAWLVHLAYLAESRLWRWSDEEQP